MRTRTKNKIKKWFKNNWAYLLIMLSVLILVIFVLRPIT